MADAAARVLDIARTARDQVEVAVKDGLPGHRTDVDADVEPCNRGVTRKEQSAYLTQQPIAGKEFVAGEIEVVAGVASRYHQSVALGHRVGVPERIRRVAAQEDPAFVGRAEVTRGHDVLPFGIDLTQIGRSPIPPITLSPATASPPREADSDAVATGQRAPLHPLAAVGTADDAGAPTATGTGDFFEAVPGGGDACVLSWVLHDWEDAAASRILANCGTALGGDGRLLIIEMLLPAEEEAPAAAAVAKLARAMDLQMLVLTGGRERSAAEYRSLLERAGFALRHVLPLEGTLWSVIEAVPA